MPRWRRLALYALVSSALPLCLGAQPGPRQDYSLRFRPSASRSIDEDAREGKLPDGILDVAERLGAREALCHGDPLAGDLLFGVGRSKVANRTLRAGRVVADDDGSLVRAMLVRLDEKDGPPTPAPLTGEWRVAKSPPELLPATYQGLRIHLVYPELRFGDAGLPEGTYKATFGIRVSLTYDDDSTETMDCMSEPLAFAVFPKADEAMFLSQWGRHLWACLHYDTRPQPEILAMAREWTRAVKRSDVRPEFPFVGTVYQELAPADEAYDFYCYAWQSSPEWFWDYTYRERLREVCRKAGRDCPVDPPLAYPPELEDQVLQACGEPSPEKLAKLFGAWFGGPSPLSPEELAQKPQLVRDTYAIFCEFYTPFSLKRLGKDLPEVAPNVRFVIVQDSVDVIVQENGRPISSLTVRDFRPSLKPMPATPLVGSRQCQELFRNAVDPSYPFGQHVSGKTLTTEETRQQEEQARERARLLEPVVLRGGQAGMGYRFSSDPTVYKIVFQAPRGRATVHFMADAWFGEARFALVKDQWRMTGSRLTGIQ